MKKTLEDALAESEAINYSAPFQTAIAFVLAHETEFVKGHYGDYDNVRTENVPGDSGGQTRYGVDKQAHPNEDIDGLTLNDALAIYWKEWRQHVLDQLPDKMAVAAFDVWVNGGHANLWLQQSYNYVNGEKLTEDGILGPQTIQALATAGNEDSIVNRFLDLRQARFNHLAQQPQLHQFLNGWTQRNEDLRALLIPA